MKIPTCWMCGTADNLRKMHDGFHGDYLVHAEYTCEECMPATDDGPTFDDLPKAETEE
jgi:hypothetical protein